MGHLSWVQRLIPFTLFPLYCQLLIISLRRLYVAVWECLQVCHKHILTSRRALITLLVSDVSRSHVKYSFRQPFKGRTNLSQIIEVILEVVTVSQFLFLITHRVHTNLQMQHFSGLHCTPSFPNKSLVVTICSSVNIRYWCVYIYVFRCFFLCASLGLSLRPCQSNLQHSFRFFQNITGC